MAQYALPPGAVKRRTVFGLLDADGWTWATLKATFWFMLIIFLTGYVPDRAYYFTVSPTIDLGYNAISPVNLCPPENKTLPCPVPLGAVIPWDQNPPELSLPEGRSSAGVFTSGENLYIVGGATAEGPTESVLTTVVSETGNLSVWQEGPPLPEARADAAVLNLSSVPYVIGGTGPDGEPTDTVFQGVVDEGVLTGWQPADVLTLPVAVTDAVGVSTGGGLYLFGGLTADGLSNTVYRSDFPEEGQPVLGAWTEVTELPLPEPRAKGTAVSTGGAVYVLGGEGPNGTTDLVYYLELDTHGDPAINPDTERPYGWGVSTGQSASAVLPAPRADHSSFVNSGAIYAIGGFGADGATVATNYFVVPDSAEGTIDEWIELPSTNLPAPVAGGALAAVGQYAFYVGGTNGTDQLTTIFRADLAPQPPFFRVGLFGVTVPALGIEGEIGQQLGYIVAASAAGGNFVILIVIAWMYSHKRESFRFFEWISRGRFRAPPEDDYAV